MKLVYYGPALSGKTTNLQAIHRLLNPEGRGRLMTLETRDDRTLFFDLLPLTINTDMGITVRIKLFTVPGQVIHNSTRRLVLQGADGVAFIADSQVNEVRANQASFKDLRRNLRENGIDPGVMPIVIQYNKRDLPNIRSEGDIMRMASQGKERTFLATATHGIGVVDTFLGLIASAFEHLEAQHALSQRFGLTYQEVQRDLKQRFTNAAEAPRHG
ncbi:MAG TPA: gliding motility protein [Polyangiales bacterium]|nr:gliding motility protein [Polyangiales bacterium]